MNKWSNLPNARHIDWVIQSLKDNPDEWNRAWDLARAEAYDLAWDAAVRTARDAVREATWGAARGAARGAAWGAAIDAALDAILALMAYDDSVKYLSMTYEELKVWATLTEEPASILLLPMVKARELIEAKNEQVV